MWHFRRQAYSSDAEIHPALISTRTQWVLRRVLQQAGSTRDPVFFVNGTWTLEKTLPSHCERLGRADERQQHALCMGGLSLGSQLVHADPTCGLRAGNGHSAILCQAFIPSGHIPEPMLHRKHPHAHLSNGTCPASAAASAIAHANMRKPPHTGLSRNSTWISSYFPC